MVDCKKTNIIFSLVVFGISTAGSIILRVTGIIEIGLMITMIVINLITIVITLPFIIRKKEKKQSYFEKLLLGYIGVFVSALAGAAVAEVLSSDVWDNSMIGLAYIALLLPVVWLVYVVTNIVSYYHNQIENQDKERKSRNDERES